MSTRVITPIKDEKRERFHVALAGLRRLNKEKAFLQKECKQKWWSTALKITVILRLMLEIRGLPLTTIQQKKCRCCGHVISERTVDVHALPKAEYPASLAKAYRDGLVTQFGLGEFLA